MKRERKLRSQQETKKEQRRGNERASSSSVGGTTDTVFRFPSSNSLDGTNKLKSEVERVCVFVREVDSKPSAS